MSLVYKMILSIVIVNYNGKAFLRNCLNSVRQHVLFQHEIIVVDNASSDGSCQYIQENFPEVYIISSDKNLGFSGGNNLGAKHAKGKYLLLLNNDTVLIKEISSTIGEFEKDTKLGVLGCRLFYGDKKPQPSIGYEHTPMRLILSWIGLGKIKNMPKIFYRVEPDGDIYSKYQPCVDWVSGAFLMTRAALWRNLNGLDEKYFMYVEDVDYCRRVRHEGYRVAYTPSVDVIHFEGSSRPWIGTIALKNTIKSYRVYIQKFYGYFSGVFFRVFLGLIMASRSFAFYCLGLVSGNNKILLEKTRAYKDVAMWLFLNRSK